jgi:hypothetical protein
MTVTTFYRKLEFCDRSDLADLLDYARAKRGKLLNSTLNHTKDWNHLKEWHLAYKTVSNRVGWKR